jgi:uncharacterized protein
MARHDEGIRWPLRLVWFGCGWGCVGLGVIGAIVPGIPTTIFFILAASCFARCSPRFEQWVLDLPKVGPLVRDYRAGLGMRRRAKSVASITMLTAASVSAVVVIRPAALGVVVVALALVGCWYVVTQVPTRERVIAERAAAASTEPEGGIRPA